MAISRRQFLKRTGLAAAGGILAPSFFRHPLLSPALADTIGDRYFVSLYLDGGNDGLGTVIPAQNGGLLRGFYEQVRNFSGAGAIGIDVADLEKPTGFNDPNTGEQLGFHPGLAAIRQLYDQGMVAVVQGCGYPEASLSHDVSTTVWETGDPLGALAGSNGWVGRHLATQYLGTDIPGVAIASRVPGEYSQNATSILAIRRLSNFGFPFDAEYPGDEGAKKTAFDALYGAAAGSAADILKYIGNSGVATALATESYPVLHSQYTTMRSTFNDKYSDLNGGRSTSTARDLREVAKIIFGVARGAPNISARFFQLANGGYDTHSDQGGADPTGRHYSLHQEVAEAVKLFFDDLADMAVGATPGSGLANLPDKVCVMIWSEFSRRVFQNDNGTDHGTQGPVFLIGGGVNGGIYGNHPNIDPSVVETNDGNTIYSQNPADPYRSTDIRDIYGTVMLNWMSYPTPGALLPLDGGDPNEYWTVSDFNLPLFV
jgi:uncharacterized protein (DUF1501 family)